MLKAYKYRIYPNNEQKIQIAKTFGCCRFVYNQTLAYRKEVYEKERIEIITNNLKQLRDMGNLIKGLKVAAYVAEIIVAGSVVIELAEKYSGKFGKKKIATGEVKSVDAATEN